MNWKILGGGGLVIASLVVVLASGFGKNPQGVSDVMVGREAPDFSLVDLDGQPVSLSSLRGAPAVLNFWSTWCQPCKIEHPHLQKAASVYGGRGVRFLGVLYQDEPDAARRMVKKEGGIFPTLIDPGQRTAIDFGVTGVPETFILDREGRIVQKITGPLSYDQASAILEGLL
jgi:cytochrome c biogenesis protein CcmG/thiol:disulfide interchange protein DsbE